MCILFVIQYVFIPEGGTVTKEFETDEVTHMAVQLPKMNLIAV